MGTIELGRLQKLRIKIFGSIPVGEIQKDGWKGSVPVYAFKCSEHGYVTNYTHGGDNLECPTCMKKRLDEVSSKYP